MSKVIGVVAGLAAAFVAIFAIEALGTMLYPLPVIEADDPDAMARIIAAMPLLAKIIVVVGYLLGAMTGAGVALRLSQWRPAGWIVAGVIAVSGIATVVMIPHPLWMQLAAVVAPAIGGWLAERHFHRARPGDPLIG